MDEHLPSLFFSGWCVCPAGRRAQSLFGVKLARRLRWLGRHKLGGDQITWIQQQICDETHIVGMGTSSLYLSYRKPTQLH